jgi:flagellar operon protein (TIGR03826 family)
MSMRNCARCGKVFVSTNQYLCHDCIESDAVDYKKVREFVKENPKVSVEVVVEATGVAEDMIREYLRQGRLSTADFSGPTLQCQRCGKPIESGTYCVLCHDEISKTLLNPSQGEQSDAPIRRKKSDEPAAFARYYRSRKE